MDLVGSERLTGQKRRERLVGGTRSKPTGERTNSPSPWLSSVAFWMAAAPPPTASLASIRSS